MRHSGHSWAFHHRAWIGIACFIPAILAVILSRPIFPQGSVWDYFFNVIAWGFFLAYLLFRIWATLFVGGRKDRELQTGGPYSLMRNPLYFGSLCFALSGALFLKSPLFLLLICLAAALYVRFVIRTEEAVLENAFGDAFRYYKKSTPRLFPRLSNFRTPARIDVDLVAIRREMKRLMLASWMPLAMDLIMHLRSRPDWPHYFRLL